MTATFGFSQEAFNPLTLPDFDHEFINDEDINDFEKALNAPEVSPFVSLNDWKPIHQRVRRKPSSFHDLQKARPQRSKDETREGFVYAFFQWPLLLLITGWIIGLGAAYWLTRLYVWSYERLITWRGKRQGLRKNLRSQTKFLEWREAAQRLDKHLGNEQWKETDDYAYYDFTTVKKAKEQLRAERQTIQRAQPDHADAREAANRLRGVVEACVKNNFVGVENPRLYSETYHGTKRLAQEFVDELHASLTCLLQSSILSNSEKFSLAKHLHTNFGRTGSFPMILLTVLQPRACVFGFRSLLVIKKSSDDVFLNSIMPVWRGLFCMVSLWRGSRCVQSERTCPAIFSPSAEEPLRLSRILR